MRVAWTMVERTELENEYEYTIETDDNTDHVHLYYTHSIDLDNPACLKFDPLYESADGVEGQVSSKTVMIPYIRVLRIIKRIEPD